MLRKPSRQIFAAVLAMLFVMGCAKPEPLTAEQAQTIVGDLSGRREPIYAEVPQRVWWNPKAPKDDYDELAVRTLRNLERAGLVTVKETLGPDSAEYIAKVTEKGFPILGTAPSHRGPVYRGTICFKRYDGLRGFMRHPNEPTVGSAEIVWHYAEPTWLYPLFETKINKPLDKPFVSQVSFWYEKHAWHYKVMVPKTPA